MGVVWQELSKTLARVRRSGERLGGAEQSKGRVFWGMKWQSSKRGTS